MTVKENEVVSNISTGKYTGKERYGIVMDGFVRIPADDMYKFYLSSDDGSRLYIDGIVTIDHDGLHGTTEKNSSVALAAGFHTIRIEFFEKTGGDELKLFIESIKTGKKEAGAGLLFH